MTPSHQQVMKLLLLMTTLQAVHLLITKQPVVEGPLMAVELPMVMGLPMVKVKELLVVEVLHQEQISPLGEWKKQEPVSFCYNYSLTPGTIDKAMIPFKG